MRLNALPRCGILTMASMPKRNLLMSTLRSTLLLATLLAMALNALASPVKLIWDTDFMSDCDDPSATLYAVRGLGPGARKYWALDSGRIQINDDATFVWTSGATGPRTESRMISARTRPDIGLLTLDEVDEIVEDLMIQAPLGALPDAPSAPSTCTAETNATVRGLITLTWAPCTVAHPASWVAGYEVRRNGALIGKALGPRFVDTVSATGDYLYRIQAYTPSGVLGEALAVPVHVERVADKP